MGGGHLSSEAQLPSDHAISKAKRRAAFAARRCALGTLRSPALFGFLLEDGGNHAEKRGLGTDCRVAGVEDRGGLCGIFLEAQGGRDIHHGARCARPIFGLRAVLHGEIRQCVEALANSLFARLLHDLQRAEILREIRRDDDDHGAEVFPQPGDDFSPTDFLGKSMQAASALGKIIRSAARISFGPFIPSPPPAAVAHRQARKHDRELISTAAERLVRA